MDAIFAYASFLRFIKVSRRLNIFSGIGEDDNSLQRRRRSLSCWTLRNCASPESALALRAASTSPCHAGDSISSGFFDSEAHSNSIAWSCSALLSRETSSFSSRTLIEWKHSSRDTRAQRFLYPKNRGQEKVRSKKY